MSAGFGLLRAAIVTIGVLTCASAALAQQPSPAAMSTARELIAVKGATSMYDTVIPGVIMSGEFSGDRADVRCAARWAAGRWSLEVARRLDTGSANDVAIESGVFMRVAAFDHTQVRHTRHVRPVRLEVE